MITHKLYGVDQRTSSTEGNSLIRPKFRCEANLESFIKIEAGNFHHCTVFVYWEIPSIFIPLTCCTLNFRTDFRKSNDAD